MSKVSQRADIFVKLLLLFGLSAVSILTFSLTQHFSFLTRRVDELEKRPIAVRGSALETPEAGASAVIATIPASSTPIPSTRSTTGTPQPSASGTPLAVAAARQTTYIPYSISGSTTSTGWVDIAGNDAYINVISEYGSGAYITWEASLSVEAGSGEVRARLFDITHGVAVPASEISVTSGTASFVSSPKLILLSGNNLYRVQISSKTSTTSTFHSGRIKIVH